jgi:DNA-binding IclR family transcriptional regulator
MYRRVDWMKAADQSILQILGGPQKLELTTGVIARNTGLNSSYTSERLSVLVEKGLVIKDEAEGSYPYYRISDLGEKVLAGEVKPEKINDE